MTYINEASIQMRMSRWVWVGPVFAVWPMIKCPRKACQSGNNWWDRWAQLSGACSLPLALRCAALDNSTALDSGTHLEDVADKVTRAEVISLSLSMASG